MEFAGELKFLGGTVLFLKEGTALSVIHITGQIIPGL